MNQYVEIVIEQARDLEVVLNKLFHSTKPSSRMQELASNLKKVKQQEEGGEEEQSSKLAIHACFLTFDALTNDQCMREILRTCKADEFEHLTEVVNTCLSISLQKELRILTPSVQISSEEAKFEESTSKFLKTYVL